MMNECDTRKGNTCTGNSTGFDGINLIYAGGHCHAPTCISMELFNADTGMMLCRQDPVAGQSDQVQMLRLLFWHTSEVQAMSESSKSSLLDVGL